MEWVFLVFFIVGCLCCAVKAGRWLERRLLDSLLQQSEPPKTLTLFSGSDGWPSYPTVPACNETQPDTYCVIPDDDEGDLDAEDDWEDDSDIDLAYEPDEGGHPEYLKLLDEMRELHIKKAADYGRLSDPFANVRASADFGMPAWVGVMVRAGDKMHRIKSFIANGSLRNESVEDSLKDLAAYALIALVLLREEQDAPVDPVCETLGAVSPHGAYVGKPVDFYLADACKKDGDR